MSRGFETGIIAAQLALRNTTNGFKIMKYIIENHVLIATYRIDCTHSPGSNKIEIQNPKSGRVDLFFKKNLVKKY